MSHKNKSKNSEGSKKVSKPRRECEAPTDWRATFEENERRLLELTYSAVPAQRLAWVEEALELAYRVGALKSQNKWANPWRIEKLICPHSS